MVMVSPGLVGRGITAEDSLDNLFSMFSSEPVALLVEFFHRLTSKGHSREDISGYVDDAFDYLEECDYTLDAYGGEEAKRIEKLAAESKIDVLSKLEKVDGRLLLVLLDFPLHRSLWLPPGTNVDALMDVWCHVAQELLAVLARDSRVVSYVSGEISAERVLLHAHNLMRIGIAAFQTSSWLHTGECPILRIRIFGLVGDLITCRLPAATVAEGVELLSYQPTPDLVPLTLARTDSWLARRRFRGILAKQQAARLGLAESVQETRVWRVIDALPFAPPSQVRAALLNGRVADPVSRTDTLLAVLQRLLVLCTAETKASPIAGRVRKLNWWSDWFHNAVRTHAPADAVLTTLYSMATSTPQSTDSLSPIVRSLKRLAVNAADKGALPRRPYVVNSLLTRAPTHLDTEGTLSTALPGTVAAPQAVALRPCPEPVEKVVATASRPRTETYPGLSTVSAGNDVVAIVENVWLQVDTDPKALIRAGDEESVKDVYEGHECSTVAGLFRLFGKGVSWTPVVKLEAGAVEDTSATLHVPFTSVQAWTYGTVGSLAAREGEEAPFAFTSSASGGRLASTGRGDEPCFLLIVTQEMIVKLLPFQSGEVMELTDALTDLTGRSPFTEKAFIHRVLSSIEPLARVEALSKITEGKHPWIRHTKQLQELVRRLTIARRRPALMDMERLFHSCRLSEEVTRETIAELRRVWRNSHTEPVRLRTLAIAARLLDRSILRASNGTFQALTSWLASLEAGLDPYKSAQSIRVVHELIKRSTRISRQLVMPIASSQLDEYMDVADEFYAETQWTR